jgi:hypothetical protein
MNPPSGWCYFLVVEQQACPQQDELSQQVLAPGKAPAVKANINVRPIRAEVSFLISELHS